MTAIIRDIPCPGGDETAPLKALIFDSVYNSYLGVVVYIRVMDGTLKSGEKIKLMHTGAEFDVVEVGVMGPVRTQTHRRAFGGRGRIFHSFNQKRKRYASRRYRNTL